MSDQTVDPPNFPLAEMPRMGRRNAISIDDEGFSSPLNLLNRASIASTIIDEVAKDKHSVQSSKLLEQTDAEQDSESKADATVKASEAISIQEDHHNENEKEEGPQPPVVTTEVSEAPDASAPAPQTEVPKVPSEHTSNLKKARVRLDSLKEDGKQPLTLIPWKKQEDTKTTVLEEQRKMFESFEMTSPDPPETPEASESKLRKMMNKMKVKRGFDASESKDKVSVHFQRGAANKEKDPYANVPAKVNTRWDKVAEDSNSKTPRPNTTGPSSGKSKPDKTQSKNKTSSAPTVAAAQRQKSFTSHIAAVNNKAFLTKRRLSEKIPLTLGPRLTQKRGFQPSQTRAQIISEVTRRLYNGPTPIQRFKNEILKQHEQQQQQLRAATGHDNKSTLFNLHRVNNVGIIAQNKPQPQQQQTLHQIVGHLSNTTGMLVGGPLRRHAPPLQTIQPPPSPFLQSNVSIPNQLIEIPMNGDIVQTIKKLRAGGKVNLGSNVVVSIKKKSGKVAPTEGGKAKVAKAPPPNKYNKIYIGPYSGSESEGEDRLAAPQKPAEALSGKQAEQTVTTAEKPAMKLKRSKSTKVKEAA